MSWDLDASQQTQIGALSNQYPFVWLFEVEVPTDPATRLRIARYNEDVTYGQDSDGADITYSAYSFEVGAVKADSESSLPSITVGATNVTREIQALVEAYGGLVGQPCVLRLVNIATLGSGEYLRYEGEVLSLSSTESSVGFEVGSYNLQRQVFPSQSALRDFCGSKYKGNRCGYIGALESCDKTLNGANGCKAHDNSDRFGGFPAIPNPNS